MSDVNTRVEILFDCVLEVSGHPPQDDGAAIWLWGMTSEGDETSMHLTIEQGEQVVKALQAAIDAAKGVQP